MQPFQENMNEYRKQLRKGFIKAAYKGLMEYFADLRLHLKINILIISYLAV
jgi:hypothetical protein